MVSSFRKFVLHALRFLSTVSLTFLDHVIGLRLDALKHDYLLVLRSSTLDQELLHDVALD